MPETGNMWPRSPPGPGSFVNLLRPLFRNKMPNTQEFRIAVFAGDGIGPEITEPCVELLNQVVARVNGFALSFESLDAGAGTYLATGQALSEHAMNAAKQADAVLLGAMGLPDVRYPDGTAIAPQLDLRVELGLYAGVRPVRSIPSVPGPLADPRAGELDFVLVRESTEGLFASHGKGTIEDDRVATDTMVITRGCSERLFDFSFELARRRRDRGSEGSVTCVDKANVFKSFAFFRRIFDERAKRYPDIEARHAYVDATALNMVRQPWNFDVLVTENMFGDILSDLGAGLIGGMGMAPSADIGDEHAVFQPRHGSAADIVGQGKANPAAMFLSAAMMLEWLGDEYDVSACVDAARLVRYAVDDAFHSHGIVPRELGGHSGTQDIVAAVHERLTTLDIDAHEGS